LWGASGRSLPRGAAGADNVVVDEAAALSVSNTHRQTRASFDGHQIAAARVATLDAVAAHHDAADDAYAVLGSDAFATQQQVCHRQLIFGKARCLLESSVLWGAF
jgi:hypothetical protein